MRPTLTLSEIEAHIWDNYKYDPETGLLTRYSGKLVGCVGAYGYRVTSIRKQNMRVHRICWYMYYKQWPVDQLDHINGKRDDNRIINLREVTCRINGMNRIENRNGHLLGAYRRENGRYRSVIQIDGRSVNLGTFNTAQEAHKAYLDAASRVYA